MDHCRPTLRYWFETEVHVYALSIAASVLLSFFPFLIVMVSLCRYVFHWDAAVDVIELALTDFFPGELGVFIRRNLEATVESRGAVQITSMFLLLFTANGVFIPLEVALNRTWGVTVNRSYVKNQIISLGLIFTCGGLALISFTLTALGIQMEQAWLNITFLKAAGVPLSILALFLIYWLLPNRKIPARRVLPIAIFVGLALEGLKYINLIAWPLLKSKLQNEYGPFYISVTIVLWSFAAAMIVLAGAEWSSRSRNP